jgi:hypothetical protein
MKIAGANTALMFVVIDAAAIASRSSPGRPGQDPVICGLAGG